MERVFCEKYRFPFAYVAKPLYKKVAKVKWHFGFVARI